MSEKGEIIITKTKKGGFAGTIQISGKTMPLPSFYEIKDERLNGRECEVEREKGQIKKIFVEGKELPRKDAVKPVKKTPPPDAFCCYLPQDTKKYLPDKISNFSLLLNKMARYSPKEKAFIIPGRDGLPLKTDFPGVKAVQ
ncbi:MAG: hypothetical protein STSR0004_07310 [Peptococcaceae bacterium]